MPSSCGGADDAELSSCSSLSDVADPDADMLIGENKGYVNLGRRLGGNSAPFIRNLSIDELFMGTAATNMLRESPSVIDEINSNNVYGLSVDKIAEYRSILLRKMTIKQLRTVLSVADDEAYPPKKRVKPESSYGGSRGRNNNLVKKLAEPKRLIEPKKLAHTNKPSSCSVPSNQEMVFPVQTLHCGRFRVFTPQKTTSGSNVTVCSKSQRIIYDVQFSLQNHWHRSIYSSFLNHISSVFLLNNTLLLKMSVPFYVEASYCDYKVVDTDVAYLDITQGHVHRLDFFNHVDARRFCEALVRVAPQLNDLFVNSQSSPDESLRDHPFSPARFSSRSLDSLMNAARMESVSGFSQGSFSTSIPLSEGLMPGFQPAVMSQPSARSFPSSYMNPDLFSYTGQGASEAAKICTPSISQQQGDPSTPVQVSSDIDVVSDYAMSACAHDSEYARALPNPPTPVESHYYLHSLQERSFYIQEPGLNNSNSSGSAHEKSPAPVSLVDSDLNLHNLTNVPVYEPDSQLPIGGIQKTPEMSDDWTRVKWGDGAMQLGRY